MPSCIDISKQGTGTHQSENALKISDTLKISPLLPTVCCEMIPLTSSAVVGCYVNYCLILIFQNPQIYF